MSDPRTHEVHGDEGMPAEFIDRPDLVPGDGDAPTTKRGPSEHDTGERDTGERDTDEHDGSEGDGSERLDD